MGEDRKKYYVEAYQEDEPFLFISYAHADIVRVEAVLNILYRKGFRIWYDQQGIAIPAGNTWHDWIMKRLEKSSSFLSFMSAGIEYRSVVMEEISCALKKKKKNSDYKVVFICLDKVSPNAFPDDIKKEMRNSQFIDLKKRGGITEEFVKAVCGAKWPEQIIDHVYRKNHGLPDWTNTAVYEGDLYDDFKELFDVDPAGEYIREKEKSSVTVDEQDIYFYKISPEQIEPDTVYPIAMDNQWVPVKMYDSREYQEDGLNGSNVSKVITSRQKEEIFRCLLHNRQVIVNRASVLNSSVFSEWYQRDSSDYSAFAELVKSGSLVMFLSREDNPVEKPADYQFSEEKYKEWFAFCSQFPICCLRFDWNSDDGNRYETGTALGYVFQDFCLTLSEDHYLMERLARLFDIPESIMPSDDCSCDQNCKRNQTSFIGWWQKVQADVLKYRDDEKQNPKHLIYRRERFYKSFLINSMTKVNDGILDLTKSPFVREMKQIIDFRYSINLPIALGLQIMNPTDNILNPEIFRDNVIRKGSREIAPDELTYAVEEFCPSFLKQKMSYPESAELTLQDIVIFRNTPEWREYMRALSEGRKRSHLDQVDYYDIVKVWEKYVQFLETVKNKNKEINIKWTEQAGALSVIYRFEDVKLITVYEGDRRLVSCTHTPEDVQKMLKRRVYLYIDYICDNILGERKDEQNIFLTELRLFEGITGVNGNETYEKLYNKLRNLKFEECKLH